MKSFALLNIICILLTNLISCGPSPEQIQAQKQALIDSISKSTEEKIVKKLLDEKLEQERRYKIEQEKKKRDIEKRELKEILANLQMELEVQEQKLEDIKMPKFLRTVSEKEIQVRNQLSLIKNIRFKIEEITQTISKIEIGQNYFQTSSTIDYSDSSASVGASR